MSFSEIALRMYPSWLLGLYMIFLAFKSGNKHLIRVEKKPIIRWSIFLVFISVYRAIMLFSFANTELVKQSAHAVLQIPFQMTFLVFWEDMCYALPLVFLSMILPKDKWYRFPVQMIAWGILWFSFWSSHVYQGPLAAFWISLYIPFCYKRGQEVGFGTMAICHTLYDLSTLAVLVLVTGGH